jgi:Flp pilus assembly protein TadD
MLLACLSKETGAVLPAVLGVHALVFGATPAGTTAVRRVARSLRRVAPHGLALAIYCGVRVASLGRFSPDQSVLGGSDLVTRVSTMGAVFAEYTRLLVYPRALHLDYFYQHDPGVQTSLTPQSLVGTALLVGLLGLALWLGVRELRRTPDGPDAGGLALCAFALAFGFFLPVSHLVDFGALLAERFLFAPSLGFLLLVALATSFLLQRRGPAFRSVAATAMIGLALAAGVRSHARASEWRDEVRLWSVEAAAIPDDPRVQSNLGAALLRRGDFEGARPALARALELNPGHPSALNNLAFAELQTGRLDAAETRYRQTLQGHPDDPVAWNGLGVVASQKGQPAEAAGYFERATHINPNYATAQRNLHAALAARDAARRFVEAHRGELESSRDARRLMQIAAACRAAGDTACAERSAVRVEALAAR